jgi:hypothetical protein
MNTRGGAASRAWEAESYRSFRPCQSAPAEIFVHLRRTECARTFQKVLREATGDSGPTTSQFNHRDRFRIVGRSEKPNQLSGGTIYPPHVHCQAQRRVSVPGSAVINVALTLALRPLDAWVHASSQLVQPRLEQPRSERFIPRAGQTTTSAVSSPPLLRSARCTQSTRADTRRCR